MNGQDSGSKYVEAILTWVNPDSADVITEWMTKRGIQAIRMRAGLLLSGSAELFSEVFGVAVTSSPPTLHFPVPAELSDLVSSITVPRLGYQS